MTTPEITIIVDQRELRSGIVDYLEDLSGDKIIVNVEIKTLPVGDYVLSDRVNVERKTVSDFLSSVIDREMKGEMFGQVLDVMRAYRRGVMVLEGDPYELYGSRNISQNAIMGMLSTVSVGFGMSILPTLSTEETAKMLVVTAKKEQVESHRIPAVHGSRSKMSAPKQKEYVVGAINKIGPSKAIALLKHFGTVRGVMNASIDELMAVKDIGKMTAKTIHDTVTTEYMGRKKHDN